MLAWNPLGFHQQSHQYARAKAGREYEDLSEYRERIFPLAVATRYASDSRYVWNSGMFCFTAAAVLSAFERHAADLLDKVRTVWEPLRGHLKGDEGKEQTGSQSYIPPEAKNDKALNMAYDLLRGTQVNSAFPPNSKTAVPN